MKRRDRTFKKRIMLASITPLVGALLTMGASKTCDGIKCIFPGLKNVAADSTVYLADFSDGKETLTGGMPRFKRWVNDCFSPNYVNDLQGGIK